MTIRLCTGRPYVHYVARKKREITPKNIGPFWTFTNLNTLQFDLFFFTFMYFLSSNMWTCKLQLAGVVTPRSRLPSAAQRDMDMSSGEPTGATTVAFCGRQRDFISTVICPATQKGQKQLSTKSTQPLPWIPNSCLIAPRWLQRRHEVNSLQQHIRQHWVISIFAFRSLV